MNKFAVTFKDPRIHLRPQRPAPAKTIGWSLLAIFGAALHLANGAVIDSSSFGPMVTLPIEGAGTYVPGVAVGDIDGDGKPDIVAGGFDAKKFWVFPNIASPGSITPASFAPKVTVDTGNDASAGLRLGDLDGDGKLDVAIGADNTVIVFRNTSAPGSITAASFMTGVRFPVSAGTADLTLRDLDGDGKLDIITTGGAVLRNTSVSGILDANSFAPPQYNPVPDIYNSMSVATEDLDGDGKPDFVTTHRNDGFIRIFHNASTPGTISMELQATLPVEFGLESVAIADFNGDGKPDIATAQLSGDPLPNLVLFQNQSTVGDLGAGSFSRVDFLVGSFYRIAAADLNGDGKPELIGANDISFEGGFHSVLSVFPNVIPTGSPITSSAFASKVTFDGGGGSVVVDDLDGDGKPDLIAGQMSGQFVGVYRNTTGPAPDTTAPTITCPADIVVGCSSVALLPVSFSVIAQDDSEPVPTVLCSRTSGSVFAVGTTPVFCTATDASGNQSSCSFVVTRTALGFSGFFNPIGGADATGGSFADPLRTFKLKSTIPVKFSAACSGSPVLAGVHTLQAIKYSDQTTAGTPIDATPTDAASSGHQFRLTGGEWHFNLDTQATGMSPGIWLLRATLSDGSQHTAWIQIK